MEFLKGLTASGMIIPIVVVVTLVAIFAIVLTFARNYIKVAPNMVAVVSGRSHKDAGGAKRGYKVVTGGGFLKIPIFDLVQYLELSVMSILVEVKNAPDKDGALVSVRGVANVKILSDAKSLPLAIERFLGRKREEIETVARENLEGNLRAIVGTMSIDELIRDRQKLQQMNVSEAAADLAKLGLGIDLLTIQDISDPRGYIEALGKKRTAQVVSDATIGEAEAKRQSDIKSAEARQMGQVAQAAAEQTISDAERERDTVKAKNSALVKAEQARIEVAAQVAAAEEGQKLNIAQAQADEAKIGAQIKVQERERERKDAELKATVIVTAERQKEARLIAADAAEQAAAKDGEAKRIMLEKEGQGIQAKQTAEAVGRKALASANQAEKEAEAAGEQAKLLAQAAGRKAELLAEADGVRAKLLAEAEGVLKKAEAFKQLDEAGKMLSVLEALPPVVEALGKAGADIIGPVAKAMGEGIGNIDEIKIVDLGGGGATGRVLQNMATMPVETLVGLKEKLAAAGLMPIARMLGQRFGFDVDSLVAGASSPAITPPASAPSTPTTPA
ncbi:MAG TPA: SPFH domain-containing protein [Candidatus Paceibacterota bacterium]